MLGQSNNPLQALVVIPARMAAQRLPDKPLADIGGTPMVVRVLHQARAADVGPVVVATGDGAIMAAVARAGGDAVPTAKDLPSGSDRVAAALQKLDPDGRYPIVINVQGDLPDISPAMIQAALVPVLAGADIGTLVAEITDPAEVNNPDVVKAACVFEDQKGVFEDQKGVFEDQKGVFEDMPDNDGQAAGLATARCLYFSRNPVPSGDGPLWHHIGVYAYRRRALETFVRTPPTALETREKLEQLRALEAGLSIVAARVDRVPLAVDTPADLARARDHFSA